MSQTTNPQLSLSFPLNSASPQVCGIVLISSIERRIEKSLTWAHPVCYSSSCEEQVGPLCNPDLHKKQLAADAALCSAIEETIIQNDHFLEQCKDEFTQIIAERGLEYCWFCFDDDDKGRRLRKLNDTAYACAEMYLRSPVGLEDWQTVDVPMQRLMGERMKGDILDESVLVDSINSAHFRLEACAIADRFVEFLSLPQPNTQLCHEWDIDENEKAEIREEVMRSDILRRENCSQWLGKPSKRFSTSNTIYYKPSEYVETAMWYSGLKKEVYTERFKKLIEAVGVELDASITWLMHHPNVREKAQKLFELCGEEFKW